jgi:hypothetical protein
MTQQGAMDGSGVACMEKGFLTILPNDPLGRSVIFFDRIRAIPTVASRESVVRLYLLFCCVVFLVSHSVSTRMVCWMWWAEDTINAPFLLSYPSLSLLCNCLYMFQLKTLFYILQKATHSCQHEYPIEQPYQSHHHHHHHRHNRGRRRGRPNGFVFIENIVGYDLYTHFDRILTKTKMIMLRECFPSSLDVYHVWSGTASGSWVMDLIMPVIKQLAGQHIRLRMVCHRGYETLPAFCKLYNLNANNMSVIMGGKYSYGDHMSWIVKERVQEQQQHSDGKHQLDNGMEYWKTKTFVHRIGMSCGMDEATVNRLQGGGGNNCTAMGVGTNPIDQTNDDDRRPSFGSTPQRRLSMSSAPRAA